MPRQGIDVSPELRRTLVMIHKIRNHQAHWNYENISHRFGRSRNWAWLLDRDPGAFAPGDVRWQLRYRRRIRALAKRYNPTRLAEQYGYSKQQIARVLNWESRPDANLAKHHIEIEEHRQWVNDLGQVMLRDDPANHNPRGRRNAGRPQNSRLKPLTSSADFTNDELIDMATEKLQEHEGETFQVIEAVFNDDGLTLVVRG